MSTRSSKPRQDQATKPANPQEIERIKSLILTKRPKALTEAKKAMKALSGADQLEMFRWSRQIAVDSARQIQKIAGAKIAEAKRKREGR